MKLSPKQARFVEEYLKDLNAAGAVIRAGYSKRNAKQKGYGLRELPKIQAAITAAIQARSKRTDADADAVIAELNLIAFSNMLDYMTIQDDGSVVMDFSAVDRDKAAAILEVVVDECTDRDKAAAILEVVVDEYTDGKGDDARPVKRVKFKLADKKGALVDLGRHHGLFPNRHEHTGKDGGPIRVRPDLSKLSEEELDVLERILGRTTDA